jgi:hypothetical protein
MKNKREYLKWLGRELSFKDWDGYYTLQRSHFVANRGRAVIHQQELHKLIPEAFPEHKWLPWKFANSKEVFEDGKIQGKFLDWLGKQLGCETKEDWYQVTPKQVSDNGGGALLKRYDDSLLQALEFVSPDHAWQPWRFESEAAKYPI